MTPDFSPTSAVLLAWLGVRGPWEGPLFVRCDAGAGWLRKGELSQPSAGRLSGYSVARLVARLGRAADLERKARPHGLRHQAITRALDLTGDVREAQRFARHRDPATTMRYDDNRRDLAGEMATLVADGFEPRASEHDQCDPATTPTSRFPRG